MTDRAERVTSGCVTAVVTLLAALAAAAAAALATIPPPHSNPTNHTTPDPSHQENNLQ